MTKVPARPSSPMTFQDSDFITYVKRLWRVHYAKGNHPSEWNETRSYGPLPTARWDPHIPAPGNTKQSDQPRRAVLYAANDPKTALAEVFQQQRSINCVTKAPILSSWKPTRPLTLLNLTGNWPLRNGAAASLQTAPRNVCRNWARSIYDRLPPGIDGIYAHSTMTGGNSRIITLWPYKDDPDPASIFPDHPLFTKELTHRSLAARIKSLSEEISYHIE